MKMLRIVLLALAVAAGPLEDGSQENGSQGDGPQVQTANGIVRGTHHVAEGYSSFTGIPYATAPVGRQRFGSPLPPPISEEIFEANRNDIACPQIEVDTFIGINDCLTLNIYTPDVATPENPVAVMVYFHGGGFVSGHVALYGEDFLIKHDVVVVLVNFRVSALGHLCLRHEHIPGNAAFKDQVAALRWLRQNIAAFGGDPENFTIMGGSAGAASVGLLSLSPMASGLFERAIKISGSALAFWAVNPDPVGYATTMAQTYLGYDGDSIEELVEFFLSSSDEVLAHATTQYYLDLHHRSVPVAACVEERLADIEAFLTDSPADIMKSGQYSPIPNIFVVANKEYVNMLVPTEVENAEDLMQNLETHLPNDLVFQSDRQMTDIANRVREFYVNDYTSILESYVDYKSDSMFYHTVARAARERVLHPSGLIAPVYMLEFTYESERRLPRLPETDGITGAAHGDESTYLIFTLDIGLPLSAADQLTIDRYTTLLTNFAKYGNPTPEPDDLQWLPLTENQFHYLELGSQVTPMVAPHTEAIAFWDQIYSEVNPPLVQTEQGLVRGTHHFDDGYSSFTGIRYATAPTGRDRYASPLPPPTSEEIFEANRNDIACPQIEVESMTFIGINDCLTLNIYTPDVATPENPVAVMVYFHGGGFVMGSVAIFGEDFLIKHDVVVVFVNFRVSALGHLCLRHEHIPGNAAFKDQVAALRWLRQNIAAFGGDPENFTIMGHSAGAVSVDLLALSPMASGLFERAITASGSALAFWAVNPDPVGYATTMAQTYLDYDGDSIEELVEFFLSSSDEVLAHATMQFYLDLHHRSVPFAACVEERLPDIEAFLTDSPADIMKSGQYSPIPNIFVVANKEYVSMLMPTEVENAEDLMQNLETHLPNDLVFQSDRQMTDIVNRVREFYVNDDTPILESYVDYKSDSMFYHTVARAARERVLHPSGFIAPVYMLEFTYESQRRHPRLPETDGITGAAHGDDMMYVILTSDIGLPLSAADQLTIDRYTTLLTNFAKYGNPTPEPDDLQWLPLTENQFHYLEFGSQVTPMVAPHTEAIAFWDQIYSEVNPPLVQTEQGLVRGTHHFDDGYSSFTGIRYATAPTGRDRYASPLPPPTSEEIFEANRNDIACPQIEVESMTFFGINDCLTLNIYTPDVATPENPVAVMVYFHGGGFVMGSVAILGEDFLIKHDVVVVFVNFRINALGHLCLRHEHIPGNAAFKDQVAALRWLRQNIAAFGGDPENFTIMGHSAGAASVDLLALSPMASGLFERAITASGSALAFWAVNPDPVGYATTMAQTYLDYDGDSIEELVEFFLSSSDEVLAHATTQFYLDLHHRSVPFAACVEERLPDIEAFLTESPADIMKSEQYSPIPNIFVVANKEYVSMLMPTEVENAEDLMQNLETHLPNDLVFQSDQQMTDIANRVREFYVNEDTSILESYVDYKSDSMFYHTVARAARERVLHPSAFIAPVYMLEFTYESERRLPRLPETDGITGAAHGDDMTYLILTLDIGLPLSAADQLTIDRYTTLLTNFAKYGEPTPQDEPVAWLRVTDEQLHYLELGSELSVSHSPNAAAIAFWDEIYAMGTSARILPSLFALFLTALLLVFNLR